MTAEEIVGKTDYDFYTKESADRYRASDKEVLETRTRKDDYITLEIMGKEQIIHLAKTPVMNDKDELTGVLCIFEDVTKQKHAEREAKRAADRKGQVGSGDRSGRIRTYNFPQGRMTDHRIGLTLYKLDSIMEGEIRPILDELITHYQAQALQAIE